MDKGSMRMLRLIDNWKETPKMFSQWANTAGIAGIGAYLVLPERLQIAIEPYAPWLAGAIFTAGFIGRLVKQKSVSGDE